MTEEEQRKLSRKNKRTLIKFVCFGLSVIGLYNLYFQSILKSDATDNPVAIDINQVQSIDQLSSNYIKINDHYADFPRSLVEYTNPRFTSQDMRPESEVLYVSYPIYGLNSPYIENDNGTISITPKSNFTFLVKTTEFERVKDIPLELKQNTAITGLVINKFRKIDAKEGPLLLSQFPDLDLNDVIILEKGAKPWPWVLIISIITLTAALLLVGTVVTVKDIIKPQKETRCRFLATRI